MRAAVIGLIAVLLRFQLPAQQGATESPIKQGIVAFSPTSLVEVRMKAGTNFAAASQATKIRTSR
jgi:hypothetical protein